MRRKPFGFQAFVKGSCAISVCPGVCQRESRAGAVWILRRPPDQPEECQVSPAFHEPVRITKCISTVEISTGRGLYAMASVVNSLN